MSHRVVPKTWFEKWRSPRQFFLKADGCMGQFESDVILSMSGVQHLFDAYVAGLFARIWNDYRPCEVRLVADDFPDAQLQDRDGTLDVEITMADKKDRRMAEEHRRLRQKRDQGELALIPINLEKERVYAREAIPRVCAQKVKNYLGCKHSDRQVRASLLVYVNFSSFADPVLTDDEMMELSSPWQHNFLSIWMLCGARIFRAWPTRKTMAAMNDPVS